MSEVASTPWLVEARDDGAFVVLRLRRPPRNILDGEALDALVDACASLRTAAFARARAILLTAEGAHFSVGAAVGEHGRAEAPRMLTRFRRAIGALLDVDLPIVAVVRGQCLGGGLELACLATRIYAHPDAKFGQPEIRLGALAPVASILLPRLVGQACAEELLLSGRTLDAEAAADVGLVRAFAADPEAEAIAWIRSALLPHSASSMRLACRAARATMRRDLEVVLPALEALYLDELSPTDDAEEGVRAFLERRAPRWVHR